MHFKELERNSKKKVFNKSQSLFIIIYNKDNALKN